VLTQWNRAALRVSPNCAIIRVDGRGETGNRLEQSAVIRHEHPPCGLDATGVAYRAA
jgi:hypothetical protein